MPAPCPHPSTSWSGSAIRARSMQTRGTTPGFVSSIPWRRAMAAPFAQREVLRRAGRDSLGGRRVRLLKPMTFMNESGRSVAAVVRFYRYRAGSGAHRSRRDRSARRHRAAEAGRRRGRQPGLRSVTAALGSKQYARLRLGVGHPGSAPQVVDFVLKRATAEDQRATDDAADRALDVMSDLVRGNLSRR